MGYACWFTVSVRLLFTECRGGGLIFVSAGVELHRHYSFMNYFHFDLWIFHVLSVPETVFTRVHKHAQCVCVCVCDLVFPSDVWGIKADVLLFR